MTTETLEAAGATDVHVSEVPEGGYRATCRWAEKFVSTMGATATAALEALRRHITSAEARAERDSRPTLTFEAVRP